MRHDLRCFSMESREICRVQSGRCRSNLRDNLRRLQRLLAMGLEYRWHPTNDCPLFQEEYQMPLIHETGLVLNESTMDGLLSHIINAVSLNILHASVPMHDPSAQTGQTAAKQSVRHQIPWVNLSMAHPQKQTMHVRHSRMWRPFRAFLFGWSKTPGDARGFYASAPSGQKPEKRKVQYPFETKPGTSGAKSGRATPRLDSHHSEGASFPDAAADWFFFRSASLA